MKKASNAGVVPSRRRIRQPSEACQPVDALHGQSQVKETEVQRAEDLVQTEAENRYEQVADIGRGADQSGQHAARAVGPDLHDEGHAERPFAAHAQGGDDAQHRHLPGRRGQTAQAAEQGVGHDAQRHGAHPAQPIADPAEEDTPGGCSDQEARVDDREPTGHVLVAGGGQQVAQGGSGHLGEKAHFQAIEQPAEQRRRQGGPAAIRRSRVCLAISKPTRRATGEDRR